MKIDLVDHSESLREMNGDRPMKLDDCVETSVEGLFATTLFVDQLPKTNAVSVDIIRKMFGKFGKVSTVNVPHHPHNRQPKGYGFVTFKRSDEANAARAALQGSVLDGSTIRVQFSNPSKQGYTSSACKDALRSMAWL